jgi:hypothetical protein
MPAAIPAAIGFVSTWWGALSTAGKIWFAVKAASLVASVAYSANQASKARKAMRNGGLDAGRTIMTRDPIAPRRMILGQVLVSGNIFLLHKTGTKGEYLHLGLVQAAHEVHEIGDVYIGNEPVPLSGSAATGKYAGHIRVNKRLGTAGAAADSDLISEASSVWTSNHKNAGCACMMVRMKWNPDLFPQDPVLKSVIKGAKVYDPRTGLTVWTQNAALCTAHFLNDPNFGKGVPYSRIKTADLIEAANICDEDIVLSTSVAAGAFVVGSIYSIESVGSTNFTSIGASANTIGVIFTATGAGSGSGTAFNTEKRYTVNGTINSDQDPSDVLRDLAGAMAGSVVDTGGTWTIRAGAYRTPTITLTDDDLVSGFSMQPRQSRHDTFNRVRGVYISPQMQWAPADFPAVGNTAYKAADGGLWLDRDIQLNFTTSPATAQRLAKIELERGRQQITSSASYNLKAMQLMPTDTVMQTRARLGWSSKAFEVVDWSLSPGGDGDNPTLSVPLTMRETAAGVWDWNDGEETVVDLAPNTDLPDAATVPTPSTPTLASGTANAYVQTDGTVVPRLKVTWTTPNNIHVEQGGKVRIEYKPAAGSTWYVWNEVRGDVLEDYITDVNAGVSFNVRLQFENNAKVRGAYSATATHTVTGDTSALSAPSGLVATAGTGKAISLDWSDVTDTRLGEYGVYKNTVNNSGTATKIAEVRSSVFVDVDVALSTTYYYWVTAITRSEVESSKSSVASATTSAAAGIDTTPPSNPSAATLNTSGAYTAGDGTVYSRLVINVPSMPSGAVILNVLYRRNGSAGWIIADQRSAGGSTTAIDDLSPGTSYDVACQAFSPYGYGSSIVTATSSPFTAPNKTGGPTAPTGSLSSPASVPVPPRLQGAVQMFGSRITVIAPSDVDIDYIEIKCTGTNSDGATDYSWSGGESQTAKYSAGPGATITHFVYASSVPVGHTRARSVNRSGVASSWTYLGNVNAYASLPAGNMIQQQSSDVVVTGVKTGGSGARKVIARYQETQVFSLSGGAAYEDKSVSISGRGFTTKPDIGAVEVASSDDIGCYYNFDNGSNSSSTAWIKFHTYSGGNISAGNYRVSIEFTEYD